VTPLSVEGSQAEVARRGQALGAGSGRAGFGGIRELVQLLVPERAMKLKG